EVCCYSKSNAACDTCSVNGVCPPGCGTGFNTLACNNKLDCPKGQECCGTFSLNASLQIEIEETRCTEACDTQAGESLLCTDKSQCGAASCVSSGYSGFTYCY